jgi:hypothetical protein
MEPAMTVRPPRFTYIVSCALSLASLSGCASDSDAVEKRLAQLREEIRKLQNDSDRVGERLEAVELRQAREEAARSAPAPSPNADTVSRPRLKVLHLGPDGQSAANGPASAEGGSKEEAGPRVVLKGQGKDLALSQNEGSAPAPASK